jgi:hypothetical protein
MKKLFIPLLCFFHLLVYADVDTKDGAAITTATNQDGFTSNISKADGQTIASGADVAREGSATKWGSDANTGNNAVTVSSDAEILCYLVSGYSGTANYFSGGAAPSLCDAADCLGTDQDLTIRSDCDDGSGEQDAAIFCLESPNSGSQYIVWDWSGAGASSEGLNHWVLQYKNVNASQNWVSACDYVETTYTTGAMTAASGDMFIGIADTYDANADCSGPATIVWTGATEIDSQCGGNNNNYSEIADETCSGNITVSQVPFNTTYSVIAGLIIQK